jgi:hypothetical protein
MDRKKLLKILFYLMFLIFIANFLTLKFYWYSSIWWLDMPMHFLGGFWEGLFFIWFFSIVDFPFLKLSLDMMDFKLVYKTVLFVLLIGILWEFFEFFVNNYIGHDLFNTLDTISDIFFDLVGGTFAVFYFFFYFSKKIKRIMPTEKNII